MQQLKEWEPAFGELITDIEAKKPIKFARYGDGEFRAIWGKRGKNCDGHTYFEDMGAKLREILLRPPSYPVGLQPNAFRLFGERITTEFPDVTWFNADIIHNANIDGELGRLFEALRTRDDVVLIGPKYMQGLPFTYRHIVVPERDCWLDYERVRGQCAEGGLLLYCCSMMAEVLVDEFGGIDIGSAFDPHLGRCIRTYHKKVIERNG